MSAYSVFMKGAGVLHGLLPLMLSITLLFGFDSPEAALMTISAALFHEAGHIWALLVLKIPHGGVKARMGGLIITPAEDLGYREEIAVAAAGPATSILGAALSFAAAPVYGDFFVIYALINIATALSNLLPVRGYDGARIIYSAASLRFTEKTAFALSGTLSFLFSVLLCLSSLFFMWSCGAGFFLFFTFFSEIIRHMASRSKIREYRSKREIK